MTRFRIDRTCPYVAALTQNGAVLVARCHVAEGPWARLVGLLGTTELAQDEGLWLASCASVHTWGMRMTIACAFVDGQGRVVRVVDPLPPWRVASCAGASSVLETGAGGLRDVRVGDVLALRGRRTA